MLPPVGATRGVPALRMCGACGAPRDGLKPSLFLRREPWVRRARLTRPSIQYTLAYHDSPRGNRGTTDTCGPSAAPPTADSLRKPTQALRSLSIKLVLPPSLTRTRGGLTLIQRRRNKISRGDDCHHELGFTFVMFPHRKRQEVAITTEIFLKHRAKSATRNITIIAT